MLNDPQQRIDYNRVLWHSRRGMLELDLLLEPFVRRRYIQLDATTQAIYRRLLECEDQQLFDWFLKKAPAPDAELAGIVAAIQAFQQQCKSSQ